MRRIALCLLSVCLASAAPAQEVKRYELRETAEGYVRLDTETGAMSTCRKAGAQLVCRMAADDRLALEDETERLRDELRALEARVTALEAARSLPLPTDKDIDKTLGMAEKLLRGFLGIARDLKREAEDGKGAAPDRT